MSHPLQPLINVASVDKEIYNIRRSLKGLEQQIAKEKKVVTGLEAELETEESKLSAIEKKSREIASQLQLDDAVIDKLEKQVPLIRTQKEFVASKKQLEDVRKRRGQTEESLLEQDIVKEEITSKCEALKEKLSTAREEFEASAVQLFEKEKAEKDKLAACQVEHKALLPKLDKKMLRFYQNCLNRGLLNPICELDNQTCSGCHVLVPPQILNDVIARPDEVAHCPHCTRVIYYIPKNEEATT